jgi:hypothetical protein
VKWHTGIRTGLQFVFCFFVFFLLFLFSVPPPHFPTSGPDRALPAEQPPRHGEPNPQEQLAIKLDFLISASWPQPFLCKPSWVERRARGCTSPGEKPRFAAPVYGPRHLCTWHVWELRAREHHPGLAPGLRLNRLGTTHQKPTRQTQTPNFGTKRGVWVGEVCEGRGPHPLGRQQYADNRTWSTRPPT